MPSALEYASSIWPFPTPRCFREMNGQTRATQFNTSFESRRLRALRRPPAPFSSVPVHLGSPAAGRRPGLRLGESGLRLRRLDLPVKARLWVLPCRSAFLFVWRCGRQRYLDPSRNPGTRITKNPSLGTNWPIEARFRHGGDATTRCGVCLGAAGAFMTRLHSKKDLDDVLGNVFAAF